MKLFRYLILIISLALGNAEYCSASHIFGADLQYTWLSGNDYKVRLTLYGDCGAIDKSILGQLDTATPHILVYDNATRLKDTLKLNPVTVRVNVSPVCPKEIGNTSCSGGTLPGVYQYIYESNITLPNVSSNWRCVFDGALGGGYGAGRSLSITNIHSPSVIQLEAKLDNTSGPNSSPLYTSIPTPFYCNNVMQQYNQGAIDPNGDSLVFNLVAGKDANSAGGPVNYYYPFSPTYPLQTTSTGFTFSTVNGQMSFTPNALQRALVVNRVLEYKAGKLVGTSEREMTMVIRDNCDGETPTSSVTSLVGATLSSSNVINICKGEKLVSFDISIANPDGDTTIVKPTGVPPSATLVIYNDSTPFPHAHFSWATDTLHTGVYTFFLFIKNNHCPLFNTQTVAFTIKVSDYPTITATALSKTECIHPAAIRYTLANGFMPRTVSVVHDGVIIKTLLDSTGVDSLGIIIDSLPAGDYTAIVSSDSLCTGSVSFSVIDSGSFFVPGISKSLCKGDPIEQIVVVPVKPGAVVDWYEISGAPLSAPPVVNTNSAGDYAWYFVEYYKTCNSGPVFVNATVHPLPDGRILNEPHTLCYGDKVYLEATGGVKYTWLPEDLIRKDTGGDYAIVLLPTMLIVKVTDQFGCSDTAGISYPDIQPCCNFSFPNAFTPNNDGNNDAFRIITYGNMQFYDLAIYNRWGQMVFRTGNPYHAWDGTFGGEPCEMGVYYYYFKAQCLTGTREVRKGDITLIR